MHYATANHAEPGSPRTDSHERERAHAPLALLRITVDELDRVRAEHGALAADTALRAVAGCVAREVSPDDRVVPYGRELAVVMRSADLPDAMSLAGRIRRRVRGLSLSAGSRRISLTPRMAAAATSELGAVTGVFEGLWDLAGERMVEQDPTSPA